MLIADHIAAVHEHATALGAAATDLGLAADVPSTPGWQVADVVGHVGGIHRWATACLNARPGTGRIPVPTPPAAGLLEWYSAGHEELLATLTAAPEDLQVWTFLPAPSPLAFWARRQAHETAMHRVDVAQAAGERIGFSSQFAVDGIDELLNGFLARPRSPLVTEPPASLRISPTDAEVSWHITITPDERQVSLSAEQPADATVRASASDLYVFLWNRAPTHPIESSGDRGVLDLWRERATI